VKVCPRPTAEANGFSSLNAASAGIALIPGLRISVGALKARRVILLGGKTGMPLHMSLFSELKRRNVFRAGAAYTVTSWLVIQVAETLFPVFGLGDSAIRLVVLCLTIGFVPAIILSWAFDLTPRGLIREEEIVRKSPDDRLRSRRLDRLIIIGLVLALTYFAIDKFVLTQQREEVRQAQVTDQMSGADQQARQESRPDSYGDKSIVVLPFVNMSSDEEQEYFADGISEELLNLLARIPDLKVISRSSAFSYKGKDIKLTEVAEELDVNHILEGSVRRSGNQIRITAQLIDGRTDAHIWSETFDRPWEDIFAIQDEVAAAVVKRLKVTLVDEADGIEKTDPDAYALYLQAGSVNSRRTPTDANRAVELYQQVLAIDPGYASAWIGLSQAYENQILFELIELDQGVALVKEALDNALNINPDLAAAHRGLGFTAYAWSNDLQSAARHYEKAIELSSDPTDAAMMLFALGRIEEAIPYYERIVVDNPLSASAHFNLGLMYLFTGDPMRALAKMDTVLLLSPQRYGTNAFRSLAYLLMNEVELALEAIEAEPSESDRTSGRALVFHELGQQEKFNQEVSRLIELSGEDYGSEVALVYAWAGNLDQAFYWLERERESGAGSGWTQILGYPQTKNLTTDPRWLPFLRSVGAAPEQLATIEFNVPPLN
jgi:TolB-like protein/Tfp pilus assembly protein PilF